LAKEQLTDSDIVYLDEFHQDGEEGDSREESTTPVHVEEELVI